MSELECQIHNLYSETTLSSRFSAGLRAAFHSFLIIIGYNLKCKTLTFRLIQFFVRFSLLLGVTFPKENFFVAKIPR